VLLRDRQHQCKQIGMRSCRSVRAHPRNNPKNNPAPTQNPSKTYTCQTYL
jgi:hypothetical protein